MSLSDDVDLEEFITMKDDLSGADIKAVCTEAGLLALRERRMRVTKQDFTTAREKVRVFVEHTRVCLTNDDPCRCYTERTKARRRVCICRLFFVGSSHCIKYQLLPFLSSDTTLYTPHVKRWSTALYQTPPERTRSGQRPQGNPYSTGTHVRCRNDRFEAKV